MSIFYIFIYGGCFCFCFLFLNKFKVAFLKFFFSINITNIEFYTKYIKEYILCLLLCTRIGFYLTERAHTHLQKLVNDIILCNAKQESPKLRNPDSLLHHMIMWLIHTEFHQS